MAKTYGVLSDFHGVDPRMIDFAVEILKKEEVDGLVLNGDICNGGKHEQNYIATVFDIVGKSGLETYILPGSHETVWLFEAGLKHFGDKYKNLINTFQNPKIDKGDHHLVFLQGSDWRMAEAGPHGYSLQNEGESGIYNNEGAFLRVVNMNDLKKRVSDPDKTIVFSHVPRRFSNLETAVDMAESGHVIKTFSLNGELCEAGSIFPAQLALQLIKMGVPIEMQKKNVGNENLKALYEKLGITKAVSGHLHESAGRAHDKDENPVKPGFFVPSLFYNASCMARMKAGMVTVDGTKVAYENVDLHGY